MIILHTVKRAYSSLNLDLSNLDRDPILDYKSNRFLSTMSRMINVGASGARASNSTDSTASSPLLSQSGTHGIPLGRANLSQVAQSIEVAAVKALE